ncbi:MAG: 50S ribosomal protein L31 [Endozoicomonas sp. (ex Botrylloides leachii)]|nr:50S ribosomal protein L31 [Endozoicomonas sp. (ex Botrylloides leachii)]
MKAGIHPNYEKITVSCSCGNKIETRSTLCKNLNIEVCSKCHPFYTGTQKVMDAGGRIERFNKRFGTLSTRK